MASEVANDEESVAIKKRKPQDQSSRDVLNLPPRPFVPDSKLISN